MLNKKLRYLQIALNSTLEEARNIIAQLPVNERILIEAGTPLIKRYGEKGIRDIRFWAEQRFGSTASTLASIPKPTGVKWLDEFLKKAAEAERAQRARRKSLFSNIGLSGGSFWPKKDTKIETKPPKMIKPYIVADIKCMDRGATEVEIVHRAGADAITVLGEAPIETIDVLIEKCDDLGLDPMIDMMNVGFPLYVLRKLKKVPPVVILHRGVDEEDRNKQKMIPFHEIHRIKSNFDMMISIAGGDTIREVQRAVFNDADIVVVWKSFYKSTEETAKLAEQFLKEIK